MAELTHNTAQIKGTVILCFLLERISANRRQMCSMKGLLQMLYSASASVCSKLQSVSLCVQTPETEYCNVRSPVWLTLALAPIQHTAGTVLLIADN